MTDPQVAVFMLGSFIVIIMLGFPIAFTLMAMAVGFGYYAYFDPARQWRIYDRLEAGGEAGPIELWIEYFQGFLNNGSDRLIANQKVSVAGGALVAITHWSLETPIAVECPGAHSIHGLLSILLSLVLRDRSQHVFNKD